MIGSGRWDMEKESAPYAAKRHRRAAGPYRPWADRAASKEGDLTGDRRWI